jgi:hypothetical protein
LDPLVATAFAGRDRMMRPISFDENSRSPEAVFTVILSGVVPPMS